MRQILSILLISTFVVSTAPVSAQDVDSIPTLKERLRNVDAEVERFLDLNTANSGGLLLEQETPGTDESTEAARVRAILLSLEHGTVIAVVLRDGETVRGSLLDTTDDAFYLSIEIDKRESRLKWLGFDQVKSLEFPVPRDKVHEIPMGKRVEVVLLNGEKVRGNLLNASEQGFTLSLGEDTNREFAFDEVTSVRKLGMRTVSKVILYGVIIFSAVTLALVAGAAASGSI